MGRQITVEEQRSCRDKTKYKTLKIAEAKIVELSTLRHPKKKVRHLSSYKCKFCSRYHLTTKAAWYDEQLT